MVTVAQNVKVWCTGWKSSAGGDDITETSKMRRYGNESGEGKGHSAMCPLTEGIFHFNGLLAPQPPVSKHILNIKKKWKKRDQTFRIKRFIISLFISRLEMTEFDL